MGVDHVTMEIAADWLDRLDTLSAAERGELNAWLKSSEANARAFAMLRRTMLDTALLEAADSVRATPFEMARSRRWSIGAAARAVGQLPQWIFGHPVGAGLVAAGLALAVVVPVLMSRAPSGVVAPAAPLEFATTVGTRADHRLVDNSVLHLNAESRIDVRFSTASRDIRLYKGEAVFDVAKNPNRPFNVMAGGATVTAIGTSFEVDLVDDAVEVRVFEGVVKVAPGKAQKTQPHIVRKGEWLILDPDRGATRGRFTPETYQTWRSDWLDADNMPLDYVVARLNRYTDEKIVLKDKALSNVGLTGRFHLNRPDDTVAMISALLDIEAVRSDRRIYLSAKRPRT
jgi:transmembrane sensor